MSAFQKLAPMYGRVIPNFSSTDETYVALLSNALLSIRTRS